MIFIISQICLAVIVAIRFIFNMPDYTTPFEIIGKRLQYPAYFNLFFMLLGVCAISYRSISEICSAINERSLKKYSKLKIAALMIFCFILPALFALYYSLSIYSLFCLPLFAFLMMRDKKKCWNRIKKILVGTLLFMLPFGVGHLSYEVAVGNALTITSIHEKVTFSAEYALNHTFSVWQAFGIAIFRSGNTLLGFYVLGLSGCGELGYIQRCMLDRLEIENRRVILLDNHEFNEVIINGTWMATDPGYPDCHLLSTRERGQRRITELGGLSVAYTYAPNGSIIWRTQDYVPVDWVTIRILNGTSPLSKATITISRDASVSIWLDNNGSTTIPIGDLRGFKDSKTYLIVSVSGKEFQVSSLGEGRYTEYNFDLKDP